MQGRRRWNGEGASVIAAVVEASLCPVVARTKPLELGWMTHDLNCNTGTLQAIESGSQGSKEVSVHRIDSGRCRALVATL